VAVLLVVALIGAGVWAVYFSRWFAVTKVVITGTHRVSVEQVEQAAKVPLGRPIIRVDSAAIRRHVATIAQLATVTVATQWPNTVRITVVERTPAATVRLGDGSYEILDRDGVDLGDVPGLPAGLPLLVMDVTSAEPAAVAAAATVASSLTPTLAAKVRSISALTPNSVVLALKSGATVRWGDSSQGAIKAEVLAALMKRPAAVYDVSAPYAPTTARV
jgi:cell division protein FtsQ